MFYFSLLLLMLNIAHTIFFMIGVVGGNYVIEKFIYVQYI